MENKFNGNYQIYGGNAIPNEAKFKTALETLEKTGNLSKNENRLDRNALEGIISSTAKSANNNYNVSQSDGSPSEVSQKLQNIISQGNDAIILIPSTTYKFGFYQSNHFTLAKYIAKENKLYFYDSKGKDISTYVNPIKFINSSGKNVTISQENSLIQIDSNACGYVSF